MPPLTRNSLSIGYFKRGYYTNRISLHPQNLLMICPYCLPQQHSLARDYNIELVQPRFIPTYHHTQLFLTPQSQPIHKVRCTPTYHSQVMKVDGYGQAKRHPANNKTQYKRPNSPRPLVYKNVSRGRTQQEFYNHKGNCCYRSNQLWYDSNRQDLIKKLQCCCTANYAHQRKQLDLGSDAVFGGVIDVCSCPQSQPIPSHVQPIEEKQPSITIQGPSPAQPSQVQPTKIEKEDHSSPSKPKEIPRRQAQIHKVSAGRKETVKKSNAFNQTIVQGWPTFTIVRKRDW